MEIKNLTVKSSARLHFNSLKMNAVGGRGCGGIGLSLEDPALELNFSRNKCVSVTGGNLYLRKKSKIFAKIILDFIREPGVAIKINKFFLNQIGLGSGTQLGLSIGKGISQLYGKSIPPRKIAFLTKRAGISGIGYYAFFRGGMILDGGYKMGSNEDKKTFADHASSPPPLIGNYNFPKNWKILLIIPRQRTIDVSKFDENKFFKENCPTPLKEVEAICTDVLMGLVPAVQERDYFNFVEYLSYILDLGTKRIELELNRTRIEKINKSLGSLLANKFKRIGACKYALIPNNVILDNKELLAYEDLGKRYSRNKILENFLSDNTNKKYLLNKKYPQDKIPFLGLSSLGATMYSVLLEDYHKIDYIFENVNKKIGKDWTAILTDAKNKPAEIDIDYGGK